VPEGDVVLRTARRLHAALAGKTLITSDLRWPSLATVDLTGRDVLEVVAAGKHLLIRVSGTEGHTPGETGLTLHSHLRMEGSWHVHRTGEPWRGARPEHGIRAILANREWTAIGHRLGMLDLVTTDNESSLVGHLGPDLLAPNWDLDQAVARVEEHPDRAIGEILLDQRVIAGIGTFFMSEACFLRGVNPWLPARDVADLRALIDLAHRLMTASLDGGIQVTTGDTRRGQEQWVHSRSGRPCRRCRTPIRVAQLGLPPTQRVAFWCPSCQPGLVPTDAGAPQRPLGASRGRRDGPGRQRGAVGVTGPRTKQYRRP
jgi:endonuclease VIII